MSARKQDSEATQVGQRFETICFVGECREEVADTEGFEPSRPFRAYSLSRGAPSTTRPRVLDRVDTHLSAGLQGFFVHQCTFPHEAISQFHVRTCKEQTGIFGISQTKPKQICSWFGLVLGTF